MNVHHIKSFDKSPYQLKLVNDGAPTTKHSSGCVTFTFSLVDERTNEEIARNPQMPKYVFPISALFGKETKANIRAAFAPLTSSC